MKKRHIFIIAAASAVLCSVGMSTTSAEASTGGKTAANAVSWAQSKVNQGIDYDGAYGNQCVDLIMAYYVYLGNDVSWGNACDYVSNALPDGWSRIKDADPQAGDILIYTNSSYGHIAIYESDYISYHQNFNYTPMVLQVTQKYDSYRTLDYWGVIRPDFVKTNVKPSTSVPVTSVSLSKTTATVREGKTFALAEFVSPPNATNPSIEWSSSDDDIASVDSNGVVTGVSPGTATITASTADSNKKASCTVTVTQRNGWYSTSDGIRYYKNGVMYTGWKWMSSAEGEKTGHYSYFGSDGLIRTGWQKIDGKTYYFGSNGWMRTGWQKISGIYRYFGKDGVMYIGWHKMGSAEGEKTEHFSYFSKTSGALYTGWHKMGSSEGEKTEHWSYFGSNGWLVTGSQVISGQSYTFSSSGWLTSEMY